jgi:hypothetical protein
VVGFGKPNLYISMNAGVRYRQRKTNFVLFFVSLLFIYPETIFSQARTLIYDSRTTENKFSIDITGSILPKADIKTMEGNYHLQSQLQSSFSAGIDYNFRLTDLWSFQSGIHLALTKRNFFLHIPDSDLSGFMSTEGAPQIEDKEVVPKLLVPFLFKRKCFFNEKRFWDVSAGINLNYNAFVDDEIIGSAIADTNYQLSNIFYGEFSSNNNKKPWVTLQLGTSKHLILRNYNMLSIGIFIDLSNTDFITGHYEITVPNKPITRGTYSTTGSGLGLALRYTFTGANKSAIASHNVRAQETSHVKVDKEKVIFRGNHLSLNFSVFSTLKAKLGKQSGNYPVTTSATPGLFLGASYHMHLNHANSLIGGVQATIAGRNLNVSFNKNEFSPPLIKDYVFSGQDTYRPEFIFSLPIQFEKRWAYHLGKYLFMEAGLQLNVSTGGGFGEWSFFVQDVNNNFYEVAEVNANNDAKPWISFPLQAGHGWMLKNNNVLKLAVTANVSFTKYVNGGYRVNIPNEPVTEGTYSSTGSYIGLSLSYVFTNANYRIRKAYQNYSIGAGEN